jgi:hypothetical protein
VSSDVVRGDLVGYAAQQRDLLDNHDLSTAPQLSISQKALGTLPEDGNVTPKHVAATIHD